MSFLTSWTPMGAPDADRLDAACRALSAELGEPVDVLGVWGPLTSGALSVERWVFAYPAWRLATLAHWTDEVEFSAEGRHVVALEASKVARLLLKDHRRSGQWLRREPKRCVAPGRSLQKLAIQLDEAGAGTPASERFSPVNQWLEAVRKAG